MEVYVEARLKDVSREGFPNKDTGEDVEYYVNTLKTARGAKLEVNSKDGMFAEYEGMEGVATIEIRPREKGGYKLSLRKFSPATTLELPEEVIEF